MKRLLATAVMSLIACSSLYANYGYYQGSAYQGQDYGYYQGQGYGYQGQGSSCPTCNQNQNASYTTYYTQPTYDPQFVSGMSYSNTQTGSYPYASGSDYYMQHPEDARSPGQPYVGPQGQYQQQPSGYYNSNPSKAAPSQGYRN